MIWMVITKDEMKDGVNHVFHFNKEAIGKGNIRLAEVDEDDELSFISHGDIIISRTMNKMLLDTIGTKGVITTAENYDTYMMVKDKSMLAGFLQDKGVIVPRQHSIYELEDEKTYFVKPRYGSDSFGITTHNICKTKAEVRIQVERLKNLGYESIVEDFIDGKEFTAVCLNDKELSTYAIEVECFATNGIQTRDCKVGFKECCSAVYDSKLSDIVKKIFSLLELKHHARMDFRRGKDGEYYLIDVNLLPGLGPIDHYAKCLLLSENISYVDAMKKIVKSAN